MHGFTTFLGAGHSFYDGTASLAHMDLLGGNSDETIQHYFTSNPGADAATVAPSAPMITFFNPSAIQKDNNGKNPFNEAIIFHEALHAYTGDSDPTLVIALKCSNNCGFNTIQRSFRVAI